MLMFMWDVLQEAKSFVKFNKTRSQFLCCAQFIPLQMLLAFLCSVPLFPQVPQPVKFPSCLYVSLNRTDLLLALECMRDFPWAPLSHWPRLATGNPLLWEDFLTFSISFKNIHMGLNGNSSLNLLFYLLLQQHLKSFYLRTTWFLHSLAIAPYHPRH